MINYDDMIAKWNASVAQYCEQHKIPSMDLKNLRVGDLYDYDLYTAYKNVIAAIESYRKTPESPLYTQELVGGIKKWYVLTATSKFQKMSMRAMPNDVFARFMQRVK